MFERLGVTRVLLSVPSSAVTYTHSSCGDSAVLTVGFTIKSEEGSVVEKPSRNRVAGLYKTTDQGQVLSTAYESEHQPNGKHIRRTRWTKSADEILIVEYNILQELCIKNRCDACETKSKTFQHLSPKRGLIGIDGFCSFRFAMDL